MIPCEECLKYPICASKDHIECDDLIEWLMEYYKVNTEVFVERINSYEKYVDKELSVITPHALCLDFKKEKDHHSCMIATN